MCAATTTRPDTACAVHVLARHLQRSGADHWLAAKRVLRYLKGTKDVGITFGGRDLILEGYCDADWAGDTGNRRSTTGYVFKLAGGPVSWSSKVQSCVSMCSTEAEYTALSARAQELVYLRRLVCEVFTGVNGATVVYEDNTGATCLTKNPTHHKRTKHTDTRFHYTRERVEAGDVHVVHVPTEEQLADVLTKPLGRDRTSMLRGKIVSPGCV